MIKQRLVFHSELCWPKGELVEQRMLEFFHGRYPSIGYVSSASDPTRKYFKGTAAYYRNVGVSDIVYFELGDEYAPSDLKRLLRCDAIFLSGGHTGYFLDQLRQRKYLLPLQDFVSKGGVLIGVSAGGILMTPDIEIACAAGEAPEHGDSISLGLVDFGFYPHYSGRRAEVEQIKAYVAETQRRVYACQDGDAVVVDGDSVELIGDVVVFDVLAS